MLQIITLFLVYVHAVNAQSLPKLPDVKTDDEAIPPCLACRTLINSFNKGLERTARGKHEGGDAAWENSKLSPYSESEVRLTDITEKLCSEVTRGKHTCEHLASEHEEDIEEWWKLGKGRDDLFSWLCINRMSVCCPDNHYGPMCTRCPNTEQGQPPCNGNGKCKGAGTRKGNGKCSCHVGYSGGQCNSCADNYYPAYQDENKIICSKCHESCLGNCSKEGPMGCEACADGWMKDAANGSCIDVNECVLQHSPCSSNEFCVNTIGSYKCPGCYKACKGCDGDGPDMCDQCADGYILQDGVCVDSQAVGRQHHVTVARYLTYFGLCVATCIILQKSVAIAAVVGLFVAMYIAVSEYHLSET